ncbi:MAG: AAA family ATPase [Planctomycetes bacterium]|nr:AAA family ATPase [Planctomycetota bacterium]
MLNESGLVYKYFDLIDGFIRVKILSDEESLSLPKGSGDPAESTPPDRREYRKIVVATCVVGLEETVLPRVAEMYPNDAAAAEDLLYQICVDVNPRLEIHTVSLPAEGVRSSQSSPLTETEFESRAQTLKESMLKEIVGQDEHVETLCRAVRKAAAGLQDPTRPMGSFLLVGRTGTGKTETAKSLARNLFEKDSLIRVDCSEFALPHETAKLIGAPPGYVGHNEGGTLTEALIENPHAVVLFDEIEKGHDSLHNMLLQILDDGRLTDSKGNTVSFRKCMVLMTSNVGTSDYAAASNRLGFGEKSELEESDFQGLTQCALKTSFRPEFLNRLDGIQIYGALDPTACTQIAAMKLDEVALRLQGAHIQLSWTKSLPKILAQRGWHAEYGAREVRRTVSNLVETPLTDAVLDGKLSRGSEVKISWQKDGLKMTSKANSLRRRKSA